MKYKVKYSKRTGRPKSIKIQLDKTGAGELADVLEHGSDNITEVARMGDFDDLRAETFVDMNDMIIDLRHEKVKR